MSDDIARRLRSAIAAFRATAATSPTTESLLGAVSELCDAAGAYLDVLNAERYRAESIHNGSGYLIYREGCELGLMTGTPFRETES